jgi:hypothetical protein
MSLSRGGVEISILRVSNHPGLRVYFFKEDRTDLPQHLAMINGSEVPVSSAGGKSLAEYKNILNS